MKERRKKRKVERKRKEKKEKRRKEEKKKRKDTGSMEKKAKKPLTFSFLEPRDSVSTS